MNSCGRLTKYVASQNSRPLLQCILSNGLLLDFAEISSFLFYTVFKEYPFV